MDETKFEQELQLNRQSYQELRDQIRRDYDHQYVALAFGKIVAAAPTFDEASAAVSRLQPQPEHFVVFQANDEPIFDEFFDPYTEFQ
jgi:hypothetical protein